MAKKKSAKSETARSEKKRSGAGTSKAAKDAGSQSASDLTFEEALEELQLVVSTLENGKLTLSQSLDAYEKGVGLLKVCYGGLENAEHRIRLLTGVDDDGRLSLEDFDGTSTAEQLQAGSGTRRNSQVTGSDEDETWSDSFQDSDSVDLDDELDNDELSDDQESDDWEEGRLF